jgi:hypothetical protein
MNPHSCPSFKGSHMRDNTLVPCWCPHCLLSEAPSAHTAVQMRQFEFRNNSGVVHHDSPMQHQQQMHCCSMLNNSSLGEWEATAHLRVELEQLVVQGGSEADPSQVGQHERQDLLAACHPRHGYRRSSGHAHHCCEWECNSQRRIALRPDPPWRRLQPGAGSKHASACTGAAHAQAR